jgi:flagellar basal body-associated protein FliL
MLYENNAKKKKKTYLFLVGLVLLIVLGTIVGIVIFKNSKINSPLSPQLPSEERQARSEFQKLFFENNLEEWEEFEKRAENSTVNYEP